MNLKSIHIYRGYGSTKTYSGSLEFSNELGEIKYEIDADMSREIVAICARKLVEIAQKAANEMTAKVIEGVTALPAPGE